MPYNIQIEKRALKRFNSIPHPFQKRIKSGISNLSTEPRPNGVKKLQGEQSIYRLRFGAYRVIYHIDEKIKKVKILKVGDRKDIYK